MQSEIAATDMPRVLFLLSSPRAVSNSRILAECAAESLPKEVAQNWLDLTTLPLAPFDDLRHADSSYAESEGNELTLLTATLDATVLVCVTPTYWYNMAAPMKLYLDHWSKWLRLPQVAFRERMAGKALYVVTVNAGEDKSEDWNSHPIVESLTYTADFMAMRWGGALIGHANRPGDVRGDTIALTEARIFLQDVRQPRAAARNAA